MTPQPPPLQIPGQVGSSSSAPAASVFEKKGGADKFCVMTPLDNNRKNEGSPEASGLSRKEKKIQESEEKKNQKSKIKENKANWTLQVQKTL